MGKTAADNSNLFNINNIFFYNHKFLKLTRLQYYFTFVTAATHWGKIISASIWIKENTTYTYLFTAISSLSFFFPPNTAPEGFGVPLLLWLID